MRALLTGVAAYYAAAVAVFGWLQVRTAQRIHAEGREELDGLLAKWGYSANWWSLVRLHAGAALGWPVVLVFGPLVEAALRRGRR